MPRGRPKGSRNKQTSDESKEIEESGESDNVTTLPVVRVERFEESAKPAKAAKAPKETIQQLNDAQRQELFFQHQKSVNAALAKKKIADAAFKNACKLAKSEVGSDAVEAIKLANDLETQEGNARQESKAHRMIEIAQWVGAPIGTQLRMFSEADGVPLGLRAYEAGRRAGLKGDKAKPPGEFGSGESEQQWLSGHADGNAELAKKSFKPFKEVADEGDRIIRDANASRAPSYEVIN